MGIATRDPAPVAVRLAPASGLGTSRKREETRANQASPHTEATHHYAIERPWAAVIARQDNCETGPRSDRRSGRPKNM